MNIDINAYLQQLKNMGLSDEMIEMYRQQMTQSMNIAGAWAQQLGQFTENMQLFNQAFTGDSGTGGNHAPGDIRLDPAASLPPARQWAIACGADLAYINGQWLNCLATGLDKKTCRHLLSEWWDIDSAEELENTLRWLKEEGHRYQFDIIWQALNTVSVKESKEFLRAYVVKNSMDEEVVLERMRNMRDAIELFREDGLLEGIEAPDMMIWDFARIINLCRAGADAGYLAETAAWQYIMDAARSIQPVYRSWKQLSVSYQLARCVWGGGDEEDYARMKAGMNVLLQRPESPWAQLPWDTRLDD